MANILHRILIKANPDKVYSLFSTPEGISQWWTRNMTADGGAKPGSVMQFRFNNNSGLDVKVISQIPGKRIEWECVAGPEDWIGTKIFFDVEKYGDKTILHFGQTGWKEQNDFYMHCNCRWAYFMIGMKSLAETGKGTPYPEAIEI